MYHSFARTAPTCYIYTYTYLDYSSVINSKVKDKHCSLDFGILIGKVISEFLKKNHTKTENIDKWSWRPWNFVETSSLKNHIISQSLHLVFGFGNGRQLVVKIWNISVEFSWFFWIKSTSIFFQLEGYICWYFCLYFFHFLHFLIKFLNIFHNKLANKLFMWNYRWFCGMIRSNFLSNFVHLWKFNFQIPIINLRKGATNLIVFKYLLRSIAVVVLRTYSDPP